MAYGDALEPAGLDYIGRDTFLAWTRDVLARGGEPVRLPSSGYRADNVRILTPEISGVLGEKYAAAKIRALNLGAPLVWANGQTFGYYAAPYRVRLLDKAHAASDAITIAAGKGAEVAEKFSKGLVVLAVVGVAGAALVAYLASRRR
jgi:hypothetical protein